jgi:hypothetical protein
MTITQPGWLIPAYLANILILVPVCYALVFGAGMSSVFEGRVPESEGLRLLLRAFGPRSSLHRLRASSGPPSSLRS